MSEIEKLTEEEREDVEEIASCQSASVESYQANARRAAALGKALRILDAGSKARERIRALEAQVLASETVSKVEYDAIVGQRNTLREELRAARFRIAELEQDVAELDGERNEVVARYDALRVLVAELKAGDDET